MVETVILAHQIIMLLVVVVAQALLALLVALMVEMAAMEPHHP
jgi:hypothetical protein